MKLTEKAIRKTGAAIFAACLALSAGACKDFLDVNTNPNTPETVSANLYLAPMIHWFVMSPQWDGRFVGRYTQMWMFPVTGTTPTTWDRQGYDPGSDNGGQQWRDVYWTFGQNLIDMMTKAQAEERWDLLGVGYVLKAWGWQVLADLHGEIIVEDAFNPTQFSFKYDSQEAAYQEVERLLDSAFVNLQRTDGAVDAAYLGRTDHMYNGDRTQWLKLAYGLLAMHLNHYSNKGTLYRPQDVIAAVDQSFTSNADDALLQFTGTKNDDRNFFGRTRGNLPSYRQTQFIVNLMNGTQFGGTVDPRMSRILAIAPDGQYRGLDPNIGNALIILPEEERPNNFFGYPGTGGLGQPSRYIFSDKSKFPNMTYAELQFVKAEAAYRMGDMGTALTAYTNGISASIDFVNARNQDDGQAVDQISAAEKAAFLADPNIVPATLTLSHIMSQKFIALWGWGFNEIWLDMRRFHYTDVDPVSGTQVFRGYSLPLVYHADNAGMPVQRIRPRYNSEYIWNRDGLSAIGALDLAYHTTEMWITQP
jgi:hypothetical protein